MPIAAAGARSLLLPVSSAAHVVSSPHSILMGSCKIRAKGSLAQFSGPAEFQTVKNATVWEFPELISACFLSFAIENLRARGAREAERKKESSARKGEAAEVEIWKEIIILSKLQILCLPVVLKRARLHKP